MTNLLLPEIHNPLQQGWLCVVRKTKFASAHFLYLKELSEAENVQRFGLSSNQLAHGHNYEVDVQVWGELDEMTGMVVNLKDLKVILQEEIVEPLDFKNLNHQVSFFADRLTTLENMARFLWARVDKRLSSMNLTLMSIRVNESDDLFVEYWGGAIAPLHKALHHTVNKQKPVLTEPAASPPSQILSTGVSTMIAPTENDIPGGWVYLTRQYEFPASHRLHNPAWDDAENARVFRKCNNPNGHGHNYVLDVTVVGTPDERLGMVVDIYALDQIIQTALLDKVDHKNLNIDVPFMTDIIPTAENMVRAFWKELASQIPAPARLARLRLVETRNNAAEYWEPFA